MKKLIFVFVPLFLIFLTHCEKETDTNPAEKKITYVKTNLGGCNNQDLDILKSAAGDYADTVGIEIIDKDTLKVSVGMNYICCAPFDSEIEIVNDTVVMTISDTCSTSCYCRCYCYYTWDFLFTDFEEKVYSYKIVVKNPREEDPMLFREGTFNLLDNSISFERANISFCTNIHLNHCRLISKFFIDNREIGTMIDKGCDSKPDCQSEESINLEIPSGYHSYKIGLYEQDIGCSFQREITGNFTEEKGECKVIYYDIIKDNLP